MNARVLTLSVWMLTQACAPSERRASGRDSTTDSAQRDSAARQPIVDARGIGPVRVGMTLRELNTALGEALRPEYKVNGECDYVYPQALPKGVALMILMDSLARIDVGEPGVLTSEGAGVGDSEASIVALYGARARVTAHKYTGPTGHYVTITTPGDTLYRIIFETDGQRVERYRAGRAPGVDYVEGCA